MDAGRTPFPSDNRALPTIRIDDGRVDGRGVNQVGDDVTVISSTRRARYGQDGRRAGTARGIGCDGSKVSDVFANAAIAERALVNMYPKRA